MITGFSRRGKYEIGGSQDKYEARRARHHRQDAPCLHMSSIGVTDSDRSLLTRDGGARDSPHTTSPSEARARPGMHHEARYTRASVTSSGTARRPVSCRRAASSPRQSQIPDSRAIGPLFGHISTPPAAARRLHSTSTSCSYFPPAERCLGHPKAGAAYHRPTRSPLHAYDHLDSGPSAMPTMPASSHHHPSS